MYLEVLDSKRKKILSRLAFLKKYGFYMAGGTALALQIGHRTSLDFDFYTEKKFDSEKLFQELRKKFGEVVLVEKANNTLLVRIKDVAASFFYYPYKLIFPPIDIDGVSLTSKQDIAAMKIIAISDRGTKRDFIDIYFLMREFPLEDIFRFVKQKYPGFNNYIALRGLTYFSEAEKKQQRRLYLISPVSWPKIKKFLIEEIRKYQKNV